MKKGELTLSQAKRLVMNDKIVYVVVCQNEIVKIFDYHREAWEYCIKMGTPSLDIGYKTDAGSYHVHYNITHAKCPRFVKFELGYLNQLDLFLDLKSEVSK